MRHHTLSFVVIPAVALLGLLLPSPARATCASVKIEILQEVTFERQAFDANMVITNGLSETISDIRVDISIADATGINRGEEFFIRLDSQQGLSGRPDGTGTVAGGAKADIHWLMIPSFGAGGTTAQGARYDVGATLTYTVGTETKTITVVPDTIYVMPMPLLTLDYFNPEYVNGDDPFTQQQEAPEPYALGLRVKNTGFGPARGLKIESAQPRIIDNKLGLLVGFQILATDVSGVVNQNTLLADFGDLPAGESRNARWIMVSTLSGRFIEFSVSFKHDDSLGGELTSLIDATHAHFLVHDVLADLPGRDGVRDFLATTQNVPSSQELALYESDNTVETPVPYYRQDDNTAALSAVPTVAAPTVALSGTGVTLGLPGYFRVTDPMQGQRRLTAAVRRADGKVLNPANYWLAKEFIPGAAAYRYAVGLFDVEVSDGTYDLTWEMIPVADSEPPVTRLVAANPHAGQAPVCVERRTNLVLVAEDALNPVPYLFHKIDGDLAEAADWGPAINPFRFELRPALPEGPHVIHFRGRDAAGNDEAAHSLAVVLDESAPNVSAAFLEPASFAPATEEGAVNGSTRLTVTATDACGPLKVTAEFGRGTSAEFTDLPVVARRTLVAQPGSPATLDWDGRDDAGAVVTAGPYTVRVLVDDALEGATDAVPGAHRAVRLLPLEVREASRAVDVDAVAAGSQVNARVDGDVVVWQDDRTGRWQVMRRDLGGAGASALVEGSASNQVDPAVAGGFVVWVDDRNGNADIVVRDTLTGVTSVLARPGEQARPATDGTWVVFEDRVSGNADIWAYKLADQSFQQVTSHDTDQVRPSVRGGWLAWEDGRHGAPAAYLLDLGTAGATPVRLSESTAAQREPRVGGGVVAWLDDRVVPAAVYAFERASGRVTRLTYGNEAQEALSVGEARYALDVVGPQGSGDVVAGDALTGTGRALQRDAADQRRPDVDVDRVVWQELTGDRYRVRTVVLEPLDQPLVLRRGYNLLALPRAVTQQHPTAFALLSAWHLPHQVTGARAWDRTTQRFATAYWGTGAPAGDDFPLQESEALVLEATADGAVTLGPPPAREPLDLVSGTNGVGPASVPYGIRARDVVEGLGMANVVSVHRFNRRTGATETVVVRSTEVLGGNFPWPSGEGLWVTLAQPVTGWRL